MGGIDFRTWSKGKNVNEAYDKAVERAVDEHGHDPYNGTISTTSSFKDVTDEYNRSDMELDEFIEKKLEKCPKWHCFAIRTKDPVGNSLKIKTQVENLATAGKKEWVLQYEVSSMGDRYVGKAEMKADAIKIARAFCEKHQTDAKITIIRELKGSSNIVAKVHYKKDKKESFGEWIFFGIAGC